MSLNPIIPGYAIVLLIVPLAAIAIALAVRASRAGRTGGAAGAPSAGATTWWRRAGIVGCVFAMALGPSVLRPSGESSLTNIEVYYVVDRTGSMAAEDYDGTRPRLDGVRADLRALTQALPGSRFSIISFDSVATSQLPLTSDANAVFSWADTLTQEITWQSTGSNVGRAAPVLQRTLAKAAADRPNNIRLVYLMSDGENTSATESETFDASRAYVDGGAVLGYGTSAGGRMRAYSGAGGGAGTDAASPSASAGAGAGDEQYIVDTSKPGSPPAISMLDQAELERVGAELGIDYAHRSTPGGIGELTKPVPSELVESRMQATNRTAYRDVVWPLGMLAAALLIWEAAALGRRWVTFDSRRTTAARSRRAKRLAAQAPPAKSGGVRR